jgi:sugar transferase EpsL
MLKRAFDVLLVLGSAPIWLPFLALLAVVVRSKLGSPIFFRQQRPGRDGRPFTLIKFRSMTDARASDGSLLPDADRLPPFGQWLRATSLDELPELFNVLRGEMSLVGPRPLLMEYLPRYSARQARRHEVRPGLTGWAQIHGRNNDTWEQRFENDLWYVENRNLALDIKILALTILKVLRREGVAQDGQATREEFLG